MHEQRRAAGGAARLPAYFTSPPVDTAGSTGRALACLSVPAPYDVTARNGEWLGSSLTLRPTFTRCDIYLPFRVPAALYWPKQRSVYVLVDERLKAE